MRPADRRFVAVRHYHEQVNIAVVVRTAPSVRAVKPDLLGLEFRDQPPRGRLKQVFVERFHVFFLAGAKRKIKPLLKMRVFGGSPNRTKEADPRRVSLALHLHSCVSP